MDTLAAFALSVSVLLLVPGPTNTLLATAGARGGVLSSIPLLLFELLGYETAIAIWRALLIPAIGSPGTGIYFARVVAASYLSFLAIKLWRSPLHVGRAPVGMREVLITTLLNPKALVIGLVLIPTSVSSIPYMTVLACLTPAFGLGWMRVGSVLGRVVEVTLIPRTAAVALGLFSAILFASAFHN